MHPFAAVVLVALLSACSQNPAPASTPQQDREALRQQAQTLFGVLPTAMPGAESDSPHLIALGRELYHDVRLSVNNTQSCASCHGISTGGVDNQRFSKGALPGTLGGRNAPTVLNAGLHIAQFWDGRAADLQAQAKGPILNPVEMAMPSEQAVLDKLASTDYPAKFAKAFAQASPALSYDNLAHAIAAFERTLITRDRFDQFQGGKLDALSADEIAGLQTFMSVGCTACHSGALLGGSSYQKIGLVRPYTTADLGRYEVTKDDADKHSFKVPALRNVAATAPYFHDGSQASLSDAVRAMGAHQLGVDLSAEQTAQIVAFLGSLTGSVGQ